MVLPEKVRSSVYIPQIRTIANGNACEYIMPIANKVKLPLCL